MSALALAEALAPKAKENQKQSLGRGKKGSPILGNLIITVDALKQAAKEAGVSHGSLSAFRFLKENATDEELAELKRDANWPRRWPRRWHQRLKRTSRHLLEVAIPGLCQYWQRRRLSTPASKPPRKLESRTVRCPRSVSLKRMPPPRS